MNKIALYAMTWKGYSVVRHVVSKQPGIVDRVVIGADKNIENDYSEELRDFCDSNSVTWNYRQDNVAVEPGTYIFAISWRWMIDHPQNRLIVFHDSLLPKYRGFAPLVNMLINGETTIGVTAVFGAEDYDRGAVIGQKSSNISYPIKIADAIRINTQNYMDLAEEIAIQLTEVSELPAAEQNECEATYSIWRDSEDYFIDWTMGADQIVRFIDAVGSPYAGARTHTADEKIVVVEDAEPVDDIECELRHCGKVVFVKDSCPIVICGRGLLKINSAKILSDGGESSLIPLKGFRYRFR
jgi:methionyl-tRNA formyltransferase